MTEIAAVATPHRRAAAPLAVADRGLAGPSSPAPSSPEPGTAALPPMPSLPEPMPAPGSEAWLDHEALWARRLDPLPADLPSLRALSSLRLMRADGHGAQLLLSRLCFLAPEETEAWHAFGFALSLTGAFSASLLCFERALECAPNRFDIARHYVDCAEAAGAVPDLLARIEARVAAAPDDVIGLYMQAALLMHDGRYDEATDIAEVVVALLPDQVEAFKLLGQLLIRSMDVSRSLQVLRRACELDPDEWELGSDYAVACLRAYRFSEANERLEALLARHGPRVMLLCNLSNARLALGDQPGAAAAAQAAAELDPNGHSGPRSLLNVMSYTPGVTGAELLAQARSIRRFCPPVNPEPFRNSPDPARRLRIGLLSGTMKVHPVGWLTIAGLEALDPARFELIAYAHSTSTDWITGRYQAITTAWRKITALTDPELAALVREDGIDVLIDLGGYGDHGRMTATAQRLAPVQAKWVGSQAYSTGLDAMDWFISDRWETPPELAAHYSERLMILPDGYVCYSPPPDAPDVGPLPARARGRVTFGCFNNLAKVNRLLIAAWAEIMHRVPASGLLLRTQQFDDPAVVDRIAAAFLRAGIDPDRLELKGSAKHRSLLAEYNRVDIVLDPFPYCGGLTTCEALYMGVPVLTLPGESFAARHSLSHVSNIGLAEDWVAQDVADYIARAVARATDLDGLEQVRAGLRARMRASPLCDARRFGEGLGLALRHAWGEWCAQQARPGALPLDPAGA